MTDPAFSPWAFVLDAIHDAARLAQAIRAAEVAIIHGGVHYGAGRPSAMVSVAAYTQVCADANALRAANEALRTENADLRRQLGDQTDEPEFPADMLEAADR